MIEQDVYTQLSNHAGLTALVGVKIYPLIAPQGAQAPFVVYQKVSRIPAYSHSGYSTYQKVRLQISCFAETYLEAKNIAAQVVDAMETWPDANAKVMSVFLDDETDIYDERTMLYHVPVDFIVEYGE